ncbi:mismatch-specific DNA-glycosylase [Gemmobacter lanyuensis]|uniref:Mismatch-specific DNA-glycosylase n=1 Tax=Gemmobacter lanyuensis TaxID=1054497 RepID=A0A918MHG6_9RHOB|nr:mismatch-specific DNA-glycosylase [Gemmobacter lanyuensis]GGW22381.1 mismatch-specific DNA-glycosylase [Gemmobacter lanyuensis]
MILPDRLAPGLRVVFCGTAAGTVSARKGHYYAGPGNRFWPMLAETGLTPRLFRPDEDDQLLSLGIGLTDLAKTAFGADAEIPASAWDAAGLWARIAACQPATLAFTSLTAARLALGRPDLASGPLPPDVRAPGVVLWALPSPSARARSHFRAAPWHALATALPPYTKP